MFLLGLLLRVGGFLLRPEGLQPGLILFRRVSRVQSSKCLHLTLFSLCALDFAAYALTSTFLHRPMKLPHLMSILIELFKPLD
jgi:hypothetical protein